MPSEGVAGAVTAETGPGVEFDRQARVLVEKGYPALVGMTAEAFSKLVQPLRAEVVRRCATMNCPTPERIPFLIVVGASQASPQRTLPLTDLRGRPGFVSADLPDVDRFKPLDTLPIPSATAYVVFDVERGSEYRNLAPDDALKAITARGRTPLTVEEGIAAVTLFPESLEKNHCFSLAGSRCGDRRVPAIWISNRAPKLGWCWAGNPHTWLGTASCAGRAS